MLYKKLKRDGEEGGVCDTTMSRPYSPNPSYSGTLRSWFALALSAGVYSDRAYADFSKAMYHLKENYITQDIRRLRITHRTEGLTVDDIAVICLRSNFKCVGCFKYVFPIRETACTPQHATLDRLYDCQPHTRDNCILSCVQCNQKRNYEKLRIMSAFARRSRARPPSKPASG